AQMIFSDLGTIGVEKSRGFSAYRWIRDELVRRGVPASEIAFMQDFKKAQAKQRLFGDVRAGKVRFLIGSSDAMGTGVNAQLRLKALHHLDVPWLPSQIEQREGRILRQGNQHDVIDIFAYATEGSMDAQMWQNNERKARFIAAALSGDTSIRRLEDMGEGQANQFAMAKAIASGDPRLMQKAGLEADIARLERLRAAHIDDEHAVRRQIRDA
ncbi:MAG: lactate dehydrogenase, partial [Mesorhizobium sp.]